MKGELIIERPTAIRPRIGGRDADEDANRTLEIFTGVHPRRKAMIDRRHALPLAGQSDRAEPRYDAQGIALWPVIEAIADSFRGRKATAGLSITRDSPPPRSTVMGDAERIRQVLVNLVENAVRYTDAGGSIRLGRSIEGGALIVTIEDFAPSDAEASLDFLSKRFFRTDQARAGGSYGASLGLALVRHIVEADGAKIACAASELGGLRVSITLPLVPE